MFWFIDLFRHSLTNTPIEVPPEELGSFHLGANLDTRTPEEKEAQDITAGEVIARADLVDWREIAPADVRVFGVQNQNGKSDCVAETRRKLKRILFKVNKGLDVDFSSVALYRKRSNYPDAGMIATDAIDLDKNIGMTLNVLVPSEPVTTEIDANKLKPDAYNDQVAQVFRVQNGEVIFNSGDIETIAGTIQRTRKGVMVWFYATVAEWSPLVPTLQANLSGPTDPHARVIHSVTAIEPALYQGKKGLWIDDSAHFGGLSRRFITEDFFRARNFYASYPITFKFEADTTSEPSFINGNVVSLQDCLKHDGTFPLNVASTGTYGPLTTQAVKDFQKKYGLVVTGLITDQTRAKLHELYP